MTLFYLTLLQNYENGKPHPWKDAIVLNLAAIALSVITFLAFVLVMIILL